MSVFIYQETSDISLLIMKVLKSCRKLLFYTNLSRKHGVRVYGYRIPNFIINSVFLFPLCCCSIQMILFCYLYGTDLNSMSRSLYLSLGIVSIVSMYLCLSIKNDMIIETFDHLQETVEERE